MFTGWFVTVILNFSMLCNLNDRQISLSTTVDKVSNFLVKIELDKTKNKSFELKHNTLRGIQKQLVLVKRFFGGVQLAFSSFHAMESEVPQVIWILPVAIRDLIQPSRSPTEKN